MLRQQNVDNLAMLVDRAIQVRPVAGDLDVGVGSGRGAVSVFRLIRFLGPPAEPDVPLGRPPARFPCSGPFPTAPRRTGRAALTASGSPVSCWPLLP